MCILIMMQVDDSCMVMLCWGSTMPKCVHGTCPAQRQSIGFTRESTLISLDVPCPNTSKMQILKVTNWALIVQFHSHNATAMLYRPNLYSNSFPTHPTPQPLSYSSGSSSSSHQKHGPSPSSAILAIILHGLNLLALRSSSSIAVSDSGFSGV